MNESELPLSGQVNIRMTKGDIKILERLMKEKGWDRSKAARYIIRLYGKYLSSPRARVLSFEEILEEVVPEELKLPKECPKCGTELVIRSGPTAYKENTYHQIWECCGCFTLYQALYKPISFIELREG